MTNSDREFLKECAYESAKDDYESLPTLLKDVSTWAKDEGRPWSEHDFIEVLQELVNSGRMASYRYAPERQSYVPADFDVSQINNFWFRSRKPS